MVTSNYSGLSQLTRTSVVREDQRMIELNEAKIPPADMRMLQDVIASWCEEHKVALHDERAELAKSEMFDLYYLGITGHDTLLEMIRSV
jgi:hypothetical protein